ncbi:hypothetical protein [Kribbella solani]|uniref:hypothetical protein n=1 Tax=Kribbella solani TaxID=236067 RepID=UPI0029A2533B|nr:hypothetical protein [Kribbella solani]MDX2968552.1 hypothetical protein [Kribbella solani]
MVVDPIDQLSAQRALVMSLLHDLHDAGTTVVVITHDRDIAASLPRQVSIKDGRIEHDSDLRVTA